jgi:DNA-binding response OmpR family regulator
MEQTKRVLVVEDDLHIADLICLHLRDEQFEVVHSADGDEGMRLLQQGHWDHHHQRPLQRTAPHSRP